MKTGWHKYYRLNDAEITMGYGHEETQSISQLEDYLELLKRVEQIVARRHDMVLDEEPKKKKRKSKEGLKEGTE